MASASKLPLYKRKQLAATSNLMSEEVDFSTITTKKLDEASILHTQKDGSQGFQ